MPQHFSFLGYKQRKLTAGLLGLAPGLVGLIFYEDSFIFYLGLLVSFFACLSAFLSSKPFRINSIHCKVICCYLNIFFCSNTSERKNLISFFRRQILGAQTSILVSKMTWIPHWVCVYIFIIYFMLLLILSTC